MYPDMAIYRYIVTSLVSIHTLKNYALQCLDASQDHPISSYYMNMHDTFSYRLKSVNALVLVKTQACLFHQSLRQ